MNGVMWWRRPSWPQSTYNARQRNCWADSMPTSRASQRGDRRECLRCRGGPWLAPLRAAALTAITQSQSRRLKMTYRLVQTTAIRTIANGYPSTQCNSGMCLKFMP